MLSAYFSSSSSVVYGFPLAYCSRAAIMRRSHDLLRGSRVEVEAGWRSEERA